MSDQMIKTQGSPETQQNNVTQANQQNQLTQNSAILQQDRDTIDSMIRDYELLDSANENSQLVVTQEYSKYIVYLLVAVLLIALLVKFSAFSGEQRGGASGKTGGKHSLQTFFMLLGIYFFGFMILKYFQKVNEYSMLLLFMVLYLVIRMQGLC